MLNCVLVALGCVSQCGLLFDDVRFLVYSAIVQGEKLIFGRLCNKAIELFKEDWAAIREVCEHPQLGWCLHSCENVVMPGAWPEVPR